MPPENVPERLRESLSRLQVAADSLPFTMRAGGPGPWPAVDAETGRVGLLEVLQRDEHGRSGVDFIGKPDGAVAHRPIPPGRFLVGPDVEPHLLRRLSAAVSAWTASLDGPATMAAVDAQHAALCGVLAVEQEVKAWYALAQQLPAGPNPEDAPR